MNFISLEIYLTQFEFKVNLRMEYYIQGERNIEAK